MRIYVASSWRNPWQPGVVRLLRLLGHEVYDFREPRPGERGFSWSEVDPGWKEWSPVAYRAALDAPLSEAGFRSDMDALKACDACVLVLPCGASAHLELGWACGAGKRTAVLFPHGVGITAIGGHTVSEAPCPACGDLDGCHLPARLLRIEPELMSKCADTILVNSDELGRWARDYLKSPEADEHKACR